MTGGIAPASLGIVRPGDVMLLTLLVTFLRMLLTRITSAVCTRLFAESAERQNGTTSVEPVRLNPALVSEAEQAIQA